ncbi:MAG: hypothetical protein IJS12_01980 [Lachnospiraceae bacterium]|nr:hypothetical protein [Lachnospiraceae bacterium]
MDVVNKTNGVIGVSREDARVVYAGWVRESGYRNAEEILGNDSTAVPDAGADYHVTSSAHDG